MANRPRITTSEFELAHGRRPRGFGWWGFFFGDEPEPRFTPSGSTFGEAKRWAMITARVCGTTRVRVAP